MLLPGLRAASVRRKCAELLCRWLGGDLSLVDDVIRNRNLQEHLAVNSPEDPRRVFGEAVEGPGAASALQVLEHALPQALEKLTDKFCAKIDERFDALERRIRPGPYAPAEGASTKPLSITQFLDEQQRRSPEFASIRKNFAHNFQVVVSMLKHEAIRSSGRSSAGGKRTSYTERDRPLLNHAWDISQAFREALTAGRNRPTVIDLLRAG